MGCMPIVIIPVRNDLSSRLLARQITLCANGGPTVLPQVVNVWISGDEIRDRVSAIVNDNQLLRLIVLTQEVGDGLRHKGATVIGGHNAADQRSGVGRRRQDTRAAYRGTTRHCRRVHSIEGAVIWREEWLA